MKRALIAVLSVLALAACNAQQNANVQKFADQVKATITNACVIDGKYQPVVVSLASTAVNTSAAVAPLAAALAPGAGPGVVVALTLAQAGVTFDQTVLHKAVTDACASLGGQPTT